MPLVLKTTYYLHATHIYVALQKQIVGRNLQIFVHWLGFMVALFCPPSLPPSKGFLYLSSCSSCESAQ